MSTEAKERSMQIAETILAQMGGTGRLKAMVNGRQFVALESGVQFAFSGNRKVNKVVVKLEPSDTYTVEFWKISRGGIEFKRVSTHPDTYCDQLIDLFERTTGLYLSL